MKCLKQFRCSKALAFGLIYCAAFDLPAQEPANQEKIVGGVTGKKQSSLPPLEVKTSSDSNKKLSGDNSAKQLAPGKGKKGAKTEDVALATSPAAGKTSSSSEKVAYDYELPGADGKALPLATYKGKVLLVVNLARNSTYNAQLPALEKLQQQYKDKGLVVLGVPSNEFGATEPGTDPEIQKVYKTDDKVTFPVTARSLLTGVQELPLYTFLTKSKTIAENGPVHWNYTKFLIDKTGKVVARFNPDVAPDSSEMLTTLEQVLDGRFRPRKASDDKPVAVGAEDGPGA